MTNKCNITITFIYLGDNNLTMNITQSIYGSFSWST